VTTVFYFERVVYILIICTNCGLCLLRNVSLIIHLWRGLLLLNDGMYEPFVLIDQ